MLVDFLGEALEELLHLHTDGVSLFSVPRSVGGCDELYLSCLEPG